MNMKYQSTLQSQATKKIVKKIHGTSNKENSK